MDEKEKKQSINSKVKDIEIPEDVIVLDLEEGKKPEEEKTEKQDSKEEKKAEEKDIEKKESKEKEADKTEPLKEEKSEKKDSGKEKKDDKTDSKDEKKSEEKKEDKTNSEDKKKSEEKSSEEKDSKDEKRVQKEKNEKETEKTATKKSDDKKDDKKDIEKDKKADVAIEDNEPLVIQGGKSHKKVWGFVLAFFAIIILGAYGAGFIYFSSHFYNDVTINKMPVNGLDEAGAKQVLDKFYSDYFLTIHTIDAENDVIINAKDIDMDIKLRDEFKNCFKQQQPYLWFVRMFDKYEFQVGADTAWAPDKLDEFYNKCGILDKKNIVKPEDAYVGVKDGKFAIINEVMGNSISEKKFKNAVEDALSKVLSEIDLLELECYSLPKVYADNEALVKELEAKSVFSDGDIKIKMDDLLLEPGMELYEDILKKNGDSYEVDYNLVKKYVDDLASQYDTISKDRDFATSFDGKHIKIKSDTFGYELDKELTLEALTSAIKAGKPTTVEATFKHKGASLLGDNDIGDSYIEVNLSEQRVVAYQNGRKIAEDDCVSGCEAAGHGTCTGLYAIQDKLSPTVLRGEKVPVTKTVTKKKNGKKVKVEKTTYEYDYESPVTYWMQFNGGIGLHDAAGWRSSYGGSIYLYNGSHGCVNLPYSFAEKLYKTFDIGTPVIVYFWDNENRK